MRPAHNRSNDVARRRGVTLLEMLVTVALLLLMMSIIASVFQAATGAVTVSRIYTLLDQDLRRLDTMIRQDLSGVTCKMTPPNDPREGRGYFEYAENALSDAQGEDSDDTLRFTAQADIDHPFTGRVWVPRSVPVTDGSYNVFPTPISQPGTANAATLTPIPVTSQYAEIIYFQRGTKLYRRVKLILPKLANSAVGNVPSDPPAPLDTTIRTGAIRIGYATNLFEPFALFQGGIATVQVGGFPFVSWQGLNDVSARPSYYDSKNLPTSQLEPSYRPVANTLGDLTDRQNRFASPRFASASPADIGGDFLRNQDATTNNVDGSANPAPDGLSDDGYINGISGGVPNVVVLPDGVADYYPTMYWNSKNAGLLNDGYTIGQSAQGGIRPLTLDRTAFPYLFPGATTGSTPNAPTSLGLIHSPDPTLTTFNHNPIVEGDSLATPSTPSARQTWWGWPTWRETMAPTWLDPIKRLNDPASATFYNNGANDPIPGAIGEAVHQQTPGLSWQSTALLPPQPDQPFSDGQPTVRNIYDLRNAQDLSTCPVFEDDLIANNVQSFNVKAFDPNPKYYSSSLNSIVSLVPGYYDLGYISGIDPATGRFNSVYARGGQFVQGTYDNVPLSTVFGTVPLFLDCLGHEGRMPPLTADLRVDPQYPAFGIGDDTVGVIRMRRIWDSWSTTYTLAPALPLDPTTGPLMGFRPVVPSYPAPYPVPLRGIQIEIRVTDPDSQYIKTLTIKQDFTEKL